MDKLRTNILFLSLGVFLLVGCGPTEWEVYGVSSMDMDFGDKFFCVSYYIAEKDTLYLTCKDLDGGEWKKFQVKKGILGTTKVITTMPSFGTAIGASPLILKYVGDNTFLIGYGYFHLIKFNVMKGEILQEEDFDLTSLHVNKLIYDEIEYAENTFYFKYNNFFIHNRYPISSTEVANYEELYSPYYYNRSKVIDNRYILFVVPEYSEKTVVVSFVDTKEFEKGFQGKYILENMNVEDVLLCENRIVTYYSEEIETKGIVTTLKDLAFFYTFTIPPLHLQYEFTVSGEHIFDGYVLIRPKFLSCYNNTFDLFVERGEIYDGATPGWVEIWKLSEEEVKENWIGRLDNALKVYKIDNIRGDILVDYADKRDGKNYGITIRTLTINAWIKQILLKASVVYIDGDKIEVKNLY